MIFIGDIACPEKKVDEWISSVSASGVFKDQVVVLNLEGVFKDDDDLYATTLHNSKRILKAFEGSKRVVVSLANNHMYDYPEEIASTQSFLQSKGIGSFGISNNGIEPYEFIENGQKYALFGHCWRLYTETNQNTVNNVSVESSDYIDFVSAVGTYTRKNRDAKVYCFMHWNYDLEKLVMPMHREIAKDLVDVGVTGVIGSHSHLPQGGEIYKGRPIVYGLGNFYLPSNTFFGGKLVFPKESHLTYALSVNAEVSKLIWFETDLEDVPVKFLEIEDFDSPKIKSLSPFASMSDNDYLTYFSKHRTKRFLVPIFDSYKNQSFRTKERFAIYRVKVLRKILSFFNR